MPQFLLIALGTLASEDLTCLATGVLVAQGRLGFIEGTLACLVGIFLGDTVLFLAGRFGSQLLMGRVSEARLNEATRWLERRGSVVVLISRFTPGLRLPTYIAAGLVRSDFWTFVGYFFLAAAIWTPLLVGGTALLGQRVLHGLLESNHVLGFAVLLSALAGLRWTVKAWAR
jgi:membrane protein DedA with SNARE-associated domain